MELYLRTIGELEKTNNSLEERELELLNYFSENTLHLDNFEKMISALGKGVRWFNSNFKSLKRALKNRDHECTFDVMHGEPAR